MALARLKLVMGVAIAVGIAATAGWIGPRRATIILPATVQQDASPKDKVPIPGNLAAPANEPTPAEDVAPARSKPFAPVPDGPRPIDEAPTPTNPPATLLAAAPTSRPATKSDPEPAGTIREVPTVVIAKTDTEIVPIPPEPKAKPESRTPPAMARPSESLREEQERGAVLFAKEWVPDDPMSHGGDGLGPVFNDTSCVACHGLGAPGGAGPESKNVVIVTAAPNGCGSGGSLDQVIPSLGNSRTRLAPPLFDGSRVRLVAEASLRAQERQRNEADTHP